MIKYIVGNSTRKDLTRLMSNTRMVSSVVIDTTSGRYLCLWRRYYPEAIFKLVFREACFLPSLPVVCGCFVVAHVSGIPKILATSAIIVEISADPLSVMRVVGKNECFVIISNITLATFAAVASISG